MSTKSQYALINWFEADSFSIISAGKILSPPVAGAICKVKNYEQYRARILAVGTESEMDRKLLEAHKFASPKRASLPFLEDTVTHEAQQTTLFQPEPDLQWYRHPITPHKPKHHSYRSDTGEDYISLH